MVLISVLKALPSFVSPPLLSPSLSLSKKKTMADVLSRSDLLVPSGRSSITRPCKKRVSSIGFRRSSLPSKPVRSSSPNSDFHGRKLVIEERRWKPMKGNLHAVPLQIQMSLRFAKTVKWWEKGIQPNMKEIKSAQDLADSLLNAGNKLVVVDFFSPGCGGCKALHPKICQFAEMNPDVQFLQVNYEEHKSMSYSLNVHVLPFFRFYRGAHGRLCSFSCTNATVQKFREAIAKHSTDRCSLGPTKGLEESELMALAANRDLGFNYAPREPAIAMEAEEVPERLPAVPMVETSRRKSEEKTLVAAWR